MSDLVGNPEDRFSRVAAQFIQDSQRHDKYDQLYNTTANIECSVTAVCLLSYEPRREKTGLRGFRPGPTQTGLYKLRKELEA